MMQMSLVFYIDDNHDERDAFGRAVAKLGAPYTVEYPELGDLMQRLWKDPLPKLIVSDMLMPANGVSVLNLCREHTPHIPVVVFTLLDPEFVSKESASGALFIAHKPHSYDESAELIQHLVALFCSPRWKVTL
jgi:CheY-like chemotaxis protein